MKHEFKKGNYAISYKEIPQKCTERKWCDGMVGGNGLNGFITSGAPYSDTFIFQNMFFIYPTNDPRYIPTELTSQLEAARYNVFMLNDSWRVTDPDGSDRTRSHLYAFHPGYQLRLSVDNDDTPEKYERWTNYETGEVGVKFCDKSGEWKRTTFASHTDNVIITKISKSSSGSKINMTVSIDSVSGMYNFSSNTTDVSALRYKRIAGDNLEYIAQIAHYPSYPNSELKEGGFAGVSYILTEGGTKTLEPLPNCDGEMNICNSNPSIKISDADYVYIITQSDRTHDMGTMEDFYRSAQHSPIDIISSNINTVINKYSHNQSFNYDAALSQSAQIQSDIFNGVEFKLNENTNQHNLDNDSLITLQRSTDNALNHAFIEQVYNQGRYVQTACGGYSAPRLYGMWTGEWNPGWRSIYTIDANVNLQISAMNTGKMKKMAEGYISFFLRNTPDFVLNAEAAYGMHDAIKTGVNSDGDRAPLGEYDNSYPFQYWNAGACWCLIPIYEFYQCFGNCQIPINPYMRIDDLKSVLSVNDGGLSDDEFNALKQRGYLDLEKDILLPLLTKQANFWEQLCTPEYFIDINGTPRYIKGKTALEDGEKYMLIPTYSPENHPVGYNSTITANATMDISAARYGLEMLIDIEQTLKRDGYKNAVIKWQTLHSQLSDYKIDSDGALCEWAMDNYTEHNNHRHISHLFLAWPGYETQNNESLLNASKLAIHNRNAFNFTDSTAGHGWIHKALVEARLKRGDGVVSALLPMTNGTAFFSSLMTDHDSNCRKNVYCTDTLLGISGVVNEALIFSNSGELELLPALPGDWLKGELNGTAARCGVSVDTLAWDISAKLVKCKLTSYKDNNDFSVKCHISWDKAYIGSQIITHNQDLTLSLHKGDSIIVEFSLK